MTIAPDISGRIDALAESSRQAMIDFRRDLHRRPEPSGEERETTSRIAEALERSGLRPRVMRDDVGVIADIDMGSGGLRFIALRADLDCVRVPDEKPVPYRSIYDGLCHACGHDAHSTMVLHAAAILSELRGAIGAASSSASAPARHIRVIFQPAEETAEGARSMIEQGALDDVEAIVALHVDPFLDPGKIGVRDGCLTAGAERFTIQVRGRGGHSARPHEAKDPIAAANAVITQCYALGPRCVDARLPAVINISSVHGGDAFNAIPDCCAMTGTLRALSIESADAVRVQLREIAQGVAVMSGCEIEIDFDRQCPPTNNDAGLNRVFRDAAASALGEASVERIALPSMGGEDFAFYQQRVPGAMVRLGAALRVGERFPLHSSRFDIDERALPIGVRLLSRAALRLAMGAGDDR